MYSLANWTPSFLTAHYSKWKNFLDNGHSLVIIVQSLRCTTVLTNNSTVKHSRIIHELWSYGEIWLTCLDPFENVPEGSAFFCRHYSFCLESVLLPLCQSTLRLSWLYPHLTLHMYETSGARDPHETSVKQYYKNPYWERIPKALLILATKLLSEMTQRRWRSLYNCKDPLLKIDVVFDFHSIWNKRLTFLKKKTWKTLSTITVDANSRITTPATRRSRQPRLSSFYFLHEMRQDSWELHLHCKVNLEFFYYLELLMVQRYFYNVLMTYR